MNRAIDVAATLGLLLVVGVVVGLFDRKGFSLRWLLVAVGLVAINDFLLTRGFGLLPHLLPASQWNWQGKILALAATLIVAALPAFGWRQSGLALVQARGSLKSCIPVALLYCLLLTVMPFVFPDRSAATPETVAFQLTLPGLEEEPFFRGILLLALERAFAARVKVFGVEWGWGAVFACALFGLAHALDFSHGHFAFDALTMALTTLPSFIAVWVRLRSGSVLIPVLLHNYGNSVFLFL